MIGIAKTEQDSELQSFRPEERNSFGLPIQVTAHERSNQTTKVDVDNSTNKLLPWFVILAIIAATGVGMSTTGYGRVSDQNTRISDQQRVYEARIADARRDADNRYNDLHDKYVETKQQADLLTYYVMEFDGKMMQRKIITPEESFSGRQLQRAKAQQEQKK